MSERRVDCAAAYARMSPSATRAAFSAAAFSAKSVVWLLVSEGESPAGKKASRVRAMVGTPSVSMKLARRAWTRRTGAGPAADLSPARSASSVDAAWPRTRDSNSSRHDATITGLSSSSDLVSASASFTPASVASRSSSKRPSKNAPSSPSSVPPAPPASAFVTLASTSAPVRSMASASVSSSALNAAPTRSRVAVSTTSAARSPRRISGTSLFIPLRSAAICASAAIRPLAGMVPTLAPAPAPPASPSLMTPKYLWSSSRPRATRGSRSLKSSAYSAAVSRKSSKKDALSDTTNALASGTGDADAAVSASPNDWSMATRRDAR
mmetsp:Transcript_14507/g.61279  ORF Transcript_14507/g.61279 Transcript_14507/m.61279 type:complete len:324 (+) Transcript_14507:554-1525(+)